MEHGYSSISLEDLPPRVLRSQVVKKLAEGTLPLYNMPIFA
jgi:hypothetical protein